jgi:crossover junction endodeoxyribonuclease RuvC
MRILGIDPGLQLTGYGAIDLRSRRPTLIDGGVIRLATKASVADRLVELEAELVELFDEIKPDVCGVEQLYAHYAHPRTAIVMGHARGVILLVTRRKGVRLVELSANRVKKNLTGNGHASKPQMQRAIQGLSPPDVADAVAIALCCGASL